MKNFLKNFALFAAGAALLGGCASDPEGTPPPAAGETASVVVPVPAEKYEAELESALKAGDSELAAYFAEYVLSADELEAFVEKKFRSAGTQTAAENAIDSPSESAREIRYTLARRLLREGKWTQAKKYFPEDLLPMFRDYVAAIQRGYNAKLSDEERARAFWDAALIVRNDGDALFLASAGPTYVSGGEWEDNPILKLRFSENLAGTDERSRVESRDISRFVNDRRFRAAMLVQNAASLLPNNDERTARLLCSAGVWLRYRDPKTADSFYKSVVIRCPQTEIGRRCAELRWFPPELPWTDAQAWDGAPTDAAAQEEPPPAADETR